MSDESIANYSVPGETYADFWKWWKDQCRQSNERLHQARLQQPITHRFKEPEPRKKKRSKKARLAPRR
jgi:hypothetical protein